MIGDEDGEPRFLVGVIEDVTERKVAEERIVHLARHDALTGIANRAVLREKLEEEPTRPRYLLTETGVGYRLKAPD